MRSARAVKNWEWVVGVNLFGVVHGIRAFLPIMEDQGLGHIVNTASMAGLLAVPRASRRTTRRSTAVVAISESLFIELARAVRRYGSARCARRSCAPT